MCDGCCSVGISTVPCRCKGPREGKLRTCRKYVLGREPCVGEAYMRPRVAGVAAPMTHSGGLCV